MVHTKRKKKGAGQKKKVILTSFNLNQTQPDLFCKFRSEKRPWVQLQRGEADKKCILQVCPSAKDDGDAFFFFLWMANARIEF